MQNLLDAQDREYDFSIKWVQLKHCQHQHLHKSDKGSSLSAKADRSSELMVSPEAVAAWLKVTLLRSMAEQNLYSLYAPPSPKHTVMI